MVSFGKIVSRTVGSEGSKWWVVNDVPPAFGCKVALARMARALNIYPYAYNIEYVMVGMMDPKGKVHKILYGIFNMIGQSKKQKAGAAHEATNVVVAMEITNTVITMVIEGKKVSPAWICPLWTTKSTKLVWRQGLKRKLHLRYVSIICFYLNL